MLEPSRTTDPPMHLTVLAEHFPSRIQPWLLNSVVEAVRRGAAVNIVTPHMQGHSYPAKVDEFGLRQKTDYYPIESGADLLRALRRYVPGTGAAAHAWAGLCRLMAHPRCCPRSVRAWAKAVGRAPLLSRRTDVFHSHYIAGAYEYLFLARVLGVPLVHTFHGQVPRGVQALPSGANEIVFRHAAMFLVNTRFAQSQLEELGCPREKIRILPQGLYMEDFDFRRRPYPSGERFVLLSVCRLTPDKGIRYAIEACAHLASRRRDFQYRIVGLGPLRNELEEMVRQLKIADCVRFVGEVTDAQLRQEYRNAHIFLFPSVPGEQHVDTQGVVMQEAQASGCMVIAARTGGIPECLDDGVAGFLVPPRDSQMLAQKIDWVFNEPKRWPEWQEAGRAWVERCFSMPRLGERLMELYREAIMLNRGTA